MIINHVEIPVLNIDKALKFYKEAFGWENMSKFSDDYILATPKEGHVSFGFFKTDKIPEKGINVVLGVADIDEALVKLRSAGAEIIREKYNISPDIGDGAYFHDVFGNYWGLHAPPKK